MLRGLSTRERRAVAAMAAVVLGLHLAGFFILIVLVAPHHYRLGASGTFTVGLGFAAYALGLRHAFDADHIAAIDNTTRKLMAARRRPLSVGFFFSLGHSTVVFALSLLFAVGLRALDGSVRNGGSALHVVTSTVGTAISGGFLYLIAALNLVILWRLVRALRASEHDDGALEQDLNSRGFMNRMLGRFTRAVSKPGHMYPLGLLFGLGFDTASEVALLFLAAGAAGAGLPFYAILCLPILFAAGMTLLDTLDGTFMNFAYGWAFSNPARKAYYNLMITGLSVAIALVVGTIELAGLVVRRLQLSGGVWSWIAGVDIGQLGYFIVAMFVIVCGLALLVWRFGRLEERWTGSLSGGAAEQP